MAILGVHTGEQQRREGVVSTLLALAAGFTDAVVYIRHGVFAANMTGNIVLLGISVAPGTWNKVALHGAPIAMFLIGVIAARLIRRVDATGAWPLVCAAAVLGVVAVTNPASALASVAMLAFAMGMQNATMTRFAGVSLNTAFMTGDLQRLGMALADPEPKQKRTVRAATIAVTILAYAIGAKLGAWTTAWQSFGLLIPAALLLLVSGFAAREQRSEKRAAA